MKHLRDNPSIDPIIQYDLDVPVEGDVVKVYADKDSEFFYNWKGNAVRRF